MLHLRYHGTTTIPLEAEAIAPDCLIGKSIAEIERMPLQHGNVEVPLAEFFHVSGDSAQGEIQLEGDCSRVKWIGTGMTRGHIVVQGPVGMHLGSEMCGGEIEVHGSAGDWVGAEMRGGRIHVHGNAGHLVGAGYRGSRLGMRGGVILIDGNAGNEIGSGMRRGLIAIGGDTGDFPGVSMIAGSLFLRGKPGTRVGAGMKRGSIVLLSECPPLLPTFRFACVYQPVFLDLYFRKLKQWNFMISDDVRRKPCRRYCGDLVALGKGELLHFDLAKG